MIGAIFIIFIIAAFISYRFKLGFGLSLLISSGLVIGLVIFSMIDQSKNPTYTDYSKPKSKKKRLTKEEREHLDWLNKYGRK